MSLIPWEDKYSVGISKIDREHKKLIGLINELHQAMLDRKGNETLEKIVKEMVNYTSTHFATEEALMKKHSYPDTDSHIQKHQGFVQEAKKLQSDLESKKLVLSIKVMNFLKDWLANHILKTDMKYSEFFKNKGEK